MRRTLAVVLTTCVALVAVPVTAGPPLSKPATAGPKTPKAPKIAAVKAPKPVKAPKAPKSTTKPASNGKHGVVTVKSAAPKNPKLAARLQAMLPPGMTVEQAALGFKNQGQFIAAVHVANNHDISFVDLKTRMVDGDLSLGQAIHQLKPSLDSDVEAASATRSAEQLLEPR